MQIHKIFSLALIAVFAAVGSALAADPLAGKLQARYDNLKSMKGEFTQILIHKESGGKEERKGVLYFKKPLLVRWETKSPVKELLIVGPQVIWNAFPDEDLAYKYPPDLTNDSRSLVRVITGQSRLEQDFIIENKGVEDGLTKLQLYPKEPTQALTEVIFWVDISSNLIKRFRITDFYGNQNEINFTSQELDTALADSLFTYTPPKKMKVEDRTKGGPVAKPLLQ